MNHGWYVILFFLFPPPPRPNSPPLPLPSSYSSSHQMGMATAEAVVRAGLTLVPYTLSGRSKGVAVGKLAVNGIPVETVPADERQSALEQIRRDYPGLVVIDYTLPSAVNANAEFYMANELPFVMGTTGGDRDKLIADTLNANHYAVIAPQMGKQIVAFQAMMEFMGDSFPGVFQGYNLEVIESHQVTKVDASGTAKAVLGSFRKMGGSPAEEKDIIKIRDENQQLEMGVPAENLTGHAYHTYRLTSGDGSVTFEFQHNVRGRRVYAEGTVDAAIFLSKQVQAKADQRLYNMVDVLKAGAMRDI